MKRLQWWPTVGRGIFGVVDYNGWRLVYVAVGCIAWKLT